MRELGVHWAVLAEMVGLTDPEVAMTVLLWVGRVFHFAF